MTFGASDKSTSQNQTFNQNQNQTTNQNQTDTSSGMGTTNQTQTSNPWAAVTPYITGTGGLLGSIASNYGQYGSLSPAQLAAVTQGLGQVQAGSGAGSAVNTAAYGLLSNPAPDALQVKGQYLDTSKLPTIGGSNVTASNVDPSSAFASLGGADPMAALSSALSGSVNNPYLSGVAAGSTASARQQYGDLLEDEGNALNYSTLPALRSEAALSGQYGGSRQGAQEGVAQGMVGQTLARTARDLTASTTATNSGLFGTAFDQAQDRAATVGQNLAGLGLTAATGNADRGLAASTANASNSLQGSIANAAQLLDAMKTNISTDANLNEFNSGVTLQNNAQRLAQAQGAAGLLGTGAQLTSDSNAGLLGLLGYGGQYATGQLGGYAALLSSLAGLGTSTNLTGQTTNNTNANSLLTGTSNTATNGTSNTKGNTASVGFSLGGGSGGSGGSGSGGNPWAWLTAGG